VAEVFSLRLPPDALKRLRRLARRSGFGPTQLARGWILERLGQEVQTGPAPAVAREPAQVYSANTPAVGANLPQDHPVEVSAICRRRGVKRLGLFGSAARTDFDPARSDLDFTVEFLDMPLGLRPAAYFGLVEEIEHLFGRHVDLVDRKAVVNPYLLAAIERDEVTLYEAP
jgi:uncharacterized protein